MDKKRVKINEIGLTKADYKGSSSTLCPGCGHNTIFNRIIEVAYQEAIDPTRVIKMSGIGCSSKSTAYFLGRSHGFNGLHGRMPSAATGAVIANHELKVIGVSGDGDSGSIGLGQFKHAVRRNVPMIYIIENNGVYGLTKGQFSATADRDQFSKYAGGVNELPPIDLCLEALAADATFVARSFAGKPKQVTELLRAALSHRGMAVLDIISPCVTFNDTPQSTKSYRHGQSHFDQYVLHDILFIPPEDEIILDEESGEHCHEVEMHDGSRIQLRDLDLTDDFEYDPTDKYLAMRTLLEAHEKQEFITGLIYVNEDPQSFIELEHLNDTPLAFLPDDVVRPSRESLDEMMQILM